MSTIRQQRTIEHIKHILSDLFLRHMKDPRILDVTVTNVTIDRELQHASIYVNALGDESRRDDVMAGLTAASGFIRRQVGAQLRLRNIPQLHFHWDPSLVYAEEVNQLLDSLEIPPPDAPDEAEPIDNDQPDLSD